jgi:hypothetical protein
VDLASGENGKFTYDQLSRLSTAATSNGSWRQSYLYDGFGNLLATNGAAAYPVDPTTNRLGTTDANGIGVTTASTALPRKSSVWTPTLTARQTTGSTRSATGSRKRSAFRASRRAHSTTIPTIVSRRRPTTTMATPSSQDPWELQGWPSLGGPDVSCSPVWNHPLYAGSCVKPKRAMLRIGRRGCTPPQNGSCDRSAGYLYRYL